MAEINQTIRSGGKPSQQRLEISATISKRSLVSASWTKAFLMAGFDPSFPMYANDWLSSPTIDLMTLAEQGAYLRLLCYCWQSQNASLPDDHTWLAGTSHLRDEWSRSSARILACFIPHPELPGMLTNRRLYAIWKERQEFRKKASEAGKKSGKIRRKAAAKKCSNEQSGTNVERTFKIRST